MTMLQHGLVPSTGGYRIERSLRFNSADSAYLNRTPASAGNRQTWTWSGWVKRGALSSFMPIYSAGPSSPRAFIAFSSADKLDYRSVDSGNTEVIRLVTTQVFRDPSAWYHIVVAQDTTQATAANRVKIYVNGVQVTAFSTETYPSQNASNLAINDALEQNYGRYVNSPSDGYLSAYITETYFIDGSAKTPSDFGETDTDTGVWKPKAYSGSYGTNGFYLKFADNSGTTSTTLGKDSSGNGNNWTPNNFSVTAGAGNDSLVDTPTPYGTDTGAGGEVRGNYATLNPLKQTGASLTNGNLQFTKSGAASTLYTIHPTFFVSSGKWYFETTPTAINSAGSLVGIVGADVALTTYASLSSMTGNIWAWRQDSYKVNNGSSSLYGNTWTANDVIGIAIDMDNGKIWWSKNGTWQASGDPAAGTNAAFTNVSGSVGPLLIDQGITATFEGSINAGQRPFAYTAPSGFKALCTQNLPTPTIGATSATRANKYFDVVLRTSNGNVGGTYSTTVNMSNGAWMWDKGRSINSSHYLLDSVRGISKTLSSDTTGAEANYPNWFTNFGSSSFTTGSDDYTAGTTVVDWIWAANGSGSTNNAGSIQSTVSAITLSGFSIVTYTGNATAGATIGHGLGATPSMIIVKDRVATSGAREWVVYHSSLGNTKAVFLSTTGAAYTGTNLWNNTSPTSAVFTVGNSSEGTNGSGNAMLAYCFAPIAGYSAFGSYTGNGSTDGPFIYTGFRPAWVMWKNSTSASQWILFDVKRWTYNIMNGYLEPNTSDAENTGSAASGVFDILSNGFKLRVTGTDYNQSGNTYVYAAFAEVPTKFSLAR